MVRKLLCWAPFVVFACLPIPCYAWSGCNNPGSVDTTATPEVVCKNGQVTVSAEAQDLDGLSKIEICVDGSVPDWTCTFSGETTGTCSYTANYGTVGEHRAWSYAYDVCGNKVESTTVTFKVIGGGIVPKGPCDKRLVLYNPASASPTDQYSAADGQPDGTTYWWTIDEGADKAETIGPRDQPTVTARAKAPSTAQNDVRIKLTYTNSYVRNSNVIIVTCDEYLYTTVQKPSATNSSRTLTFDSTPVCAPKCYKEKQYTFTIRDTIGSGSPVAWAFWDETWNPACVTQGDVYTGCNGTMIDYMGFFYNRPCGNRFICNAATQTIEVSGWGCFFRYSNTLAERACPNMPYVTSTSIGCP